MIDLVHYINYLLKLRASSEEESWVIMPIQINKQQEQNVSLNDSDVTLVGQTQA